MVEVPTTTNCCEREKENEGGKGKKRREVKGR